MNDVYVIGADLLKFGRYPDKNCAQLGGEAALLALDDAGLTVKDVNAVYCSSLFNAMGLMGQQILKQIGMIGVPVVNVANACASGATAFREAFVAIKAGVADVALVVGVEQNPKGMLEIPSQFGPNPEGIMGSASMPAVFAEAGMAHTRKYGTTFEQFAKVSVKNHHHSTMNPKSMYQIETPLEQVMGSEMIAYPNTKLMCSVNVDGAAAAVLVSEKKARELGAMGRAVKVRGSGLASDPYEIRHPVMFDANSVTRLAARQAYDMAGVDPRDVNVVELHDCFATAELLHYENLGLCGEGEAGPFIDSGATTLGGKVPVNVSGGLLSKGHPIGATGVANICEIVFHLRGEAGARQVEGARIGLAHVLGFGAAAGVHILERA
jgi:acetyl-CoA acetyltransferase